MMYSNEQAKPFYWLPLVIYGGLLVYGTLYPWHDWRVPLESEWRPIFEHGSNVSYSDIFTNIVVYIPFGFLLARAAIFRSPIAQIFAALIGGVMLSFLLESLQVYLPSRVSSFLDLALNGAGALAGGLLFIVVRPQGWVYESLLALRQAYIRSGALASASVFLLGLWALSQTSPWVPSLDISGLRQELKPLWYALTRQIPLDFGQIAVYVLTVMALGTVSTIALKSCKSVFWWFAVFVGAVLLFKIPVVGRPLSGEALVGAGIGIIGFALLQKLPPKAAVLSGIVALLGAVMIDELRIGTTWLFSSFNWIPFKGHLTGTVIGIADTIIGAWPFFALSLLVLHLRPQRPRRVLVWGGIGILVGMFALEWNQQYLAGRYPDITDALLALLAWWLPWFYMPLRLEVRKHSRYFCKDRILPKNNPREAQ
ncbi:VanZ family protein [Nitrosococcus watsonii]|uniref:VanZ family protein n=1 Tax=Nitrosococcus watsoni (strain C-113) TaxID=105559 RepID=D8K6S9_NITWC|nr:VanZ family protein [Nitrosococcus watsonii]ADJ28606.1 VanZ family protein [Nitrosococcus watsonii C-113]